MIDPNCLCLGCMGIRESEEGSCPYCGFDEEKYLNTVSARVLRPKTILAGKYMLGKVLGEGGFGITYLGWDLNLEQKIAIKEYFPVGLATRDMRNDDSALFSIVSGDKQKFYSMGLNNFALEAKNLAKFQNLPGVVSVKDFFYENQTAYLVMEYLDGINLKQYMVSEKKKCFSEEETLKIMKPIIDALIMIHKTGLIHRDISPENIIMTKDGLIKLIDFGAARMAVGAETQSLTVLLKHGYAPIEQYQTSGKQGPWTDVYALCATMYYLISGIVPQAAIDRIMEDKVENLWSESPCAVSLERMEKQVSKRVSDIIEKGLSVKIAERYQNVEELKRALYLPDPINDNVVSQSTLQIESAVNDDSEKVVISEEKQQEKLKKSVREETVSYTEKQNRIPKGKLKIRTTYLIVSAMIVLILGGYLIYCNMQYNTYETIKEHTEFLKLSSDEQAEYYMEKAKLAFEAEDYSQSLSYCDESLHIKASMETFFEISKIYEKQGYIKKMTDTWDSHKQEWSDAWEKATDAQRQQGAEIMMDAMLDRCKKSVIWILGKANITSYLEFFSDLFADYGSDEQKTVYQKYYIEMIEIAAEDNRITDKLEEFEMCYANHNDFSIVKEQILNIYKDK